MVSPSFAFGAALIALYTELGALAAPAQCYAGETADLRCYTIPGNKPQNVAIADIKFAANYLRSYGRQTVAGRLLTMKDSETADCGEFTLYPKGTVQIIAKHITMGVNSSVLYEDIANTIDGGANATVAQQEEALLGCGSDGGSFGVVVNRTHPTYSSAAYTKLSAVTSGIIIKVVSLTP